MRTCTLSGKKWVHIGCLCALFTNVTTVCTVTEAQDLPRGGLAVLPVCNRGRAVIVK